MGNYSSYIPCILLFVLPYIVFAQGSGTLPVGWSLIAEGKATSWYSPSSDFALGFQKVQGKDQFLLSIWYARIPDKTIVWFVNDGTTVAAGSKVQLTADRGLVLSDSQGDELWRSDSFSGIATNGVLDDAGNFIIFSSDSTTLWDSFRKEASKS
ncbi:Bulb-type lectin domain-containing protein [Heracleum sosnowskyi]|uniref:Bulb-type lectin domain-containing protein n=1 Tax=Heracleum sosnowskyi TaxID=360622 RepID=A0AAD8GY40_9APIA|nr:Bulb-type lectin domain-containing protein [Heracleum sosnowskyi]